MPSNDHPETEFIQTQQANSTTRNDTSWATQSIAEQAHVPQKRPRESAPTASKHRRIHSQDTSDNRHDLPLTPSSGGSESSTHDSSQKSPPSATDPTQDADSAEIVPFDEAAAASLAKDSRTIGDFAASPSPSDTAPSGPTGLKDVETAPSRNSKRQRRASIPNAANTPSFTNSASSVEATHSPSNSDGTVSTPITGEVSAHSALHSQSHLNNPGLNYDMDAGDGNTAQDEATSLSPAATNDSPSYARNSVSHGTVSLQELEYGYLADPERAREVAGFSEERRSSIKSSKGIYC